ncbi:MAG: DUF5659 domain-containing protein [Clostridiales bacterium]|nr:DUF5659 domain-containing protein [Clostridiales bacterium]
MAYKRFCGKGYIYILFSLKRDTEPHRERESKQNSKDRKQGVIMQETKNKKLTIVYSMQLAGYLMMRGFRLVRNSPDRKNPSYNVFLFRESDMLLDAIDEYQTKYYKLGNSNQPEILAQYFK